MLLIFSNSQISNNSRSESSDVTGYPFHAVRSEDLNLPAYNAELAGTQNPLPKLACVFPPPRLAPCARTFQARCGSFRDLISVTNKLSVCGDEGSCEHVSLRHHDPHLVLEHFRLGAAHFRTSFLSQTNCLCGETEDPTSVCFSTTTTHTWRWNISGQVQLISRPRQTDAQTNQVN